MTLINGKKEQEFVNPGLILDQAILKKVSILKKKGK